MVGECGFFLPQPMYLNIGLRFKWNTLYFTDSHFQLKYHLRERCDFWKKLLKNDSYLYTSTKREKGRIHNWSGAWKGWVREKWTFDVKWLTRSNVYAVLLVFFETFAQSYVTPGHHVINLLTFVHFILIRVRTRVNNLLICRSPAVFID